MQTMKCRSCSASLGSENVVGEWVKCPYCGSHYLVNYENSEQCGTHIDYYFPARDSFHDFQTACLDIVMKVSPADSISKSKEKGKSCCYIPAIANIGGKGDYKASYIGDEMFEYKNAVNEIFDYHISNNDSVLGYRKRQKLKTNETYGIEKVDFDELKYKNKVDHGDIVTNEIHYYPFYYWELEYNGEIMYFLSLGNSNNIVHRNLPIENKLKENARPVYVNASDCKKYALVFGIFILIAVVAIVIYSYDSVLKQWFDYVISQSGNIIREWWYIILLCLFFSPLIFDLIKIVSKIVGYYSIQLIARMWNMYIRHKYMNVIMPIQKKKQLDAQSRFRIMLNDLHINKEIPPFCFTY